MLEELKRFIDNIIDNLRFALIKVKNYLLSFYYSTLNFLKKHIKIIGIIFCLFAGIIVGVLFSNIVLDLLRWDHASLLGGATAGILISFLPGKETDDADQMFKQRMQRFITLWISFTVFIFALILPELIKAEAPIIFIIILIISSIIILGAILAIYIYRIEKKQKISIKWRFYTTILLITLTIIWIILLIVLYFTEIVV